MKNYSHRTRTLVTGGAGFLGSHLCELEKSQISLFMKKNNYILYLRSGNMFFFRDVSGN